VAAVADDKSPRFDPAGPELVYMAVADDIAARIAGGELTVGTRLPGEAELARQYGHSKATARRAVRELRERGLVRTVIGQGTFVI
jgi:DNA-binding GntR family transcriptional regulator